MYWQLSLTVTSGYITSISLGTFIVFLWFPQWGHHNNMSWNTEWEIQNVLAVFQVGSLLVHCPFPCDVLAVFLVGTPPLAPSVRDESSRGVFFCANRVMDCEDLFGGGIFGRGGGIFQ